MASTYRSAYQEDSDADDEYERSVIISPTLPADVELSLTDSELPSVQHTPTTIAYPADSYATSKGIINSWTPDQVADWTSSLGLGQYARAFVDENINGEALIALQHADLKEMGIQSVGHRVTVLMNVYKVKAKQNVPIEPDHYVPLSAETAAPEMAPTQDDLARVLQIIRDRDKRMCGTESGLQAVKDDLQRMVEENRKLREDVLPVVREAKNRSQPLPTPDAQERDHVASPPPTVQERFGSSLSRKFSTKLLLGSAPKDTSPTIHEVRTLVDSSSLDPSAASNHLTASQASPSPHQHPQNSPTSPAYSTHQSVSRSRSHTNDDHHPPYHERDGAPGATTLAPSHRDRDPPLSAGRNGETASITASTTGSAKPGDSSSPQVEIFKSFRVNIDDPCHKVLPIALKKYQIVADWRQYALYIVYGDQERCLGLNEKPLKLFKQLDREGRKPMFMLRKHAAPVEGHNNTISNTTAGGTYSSQNGQTLVPGGVL